MHGQGWTGTTKPGCHLQWPMRLFHREASWMAGIVEASDVETSSRLPSHCGSSVSQEPGDAQGNSHLPCGLLADSAAMSNHAG